MQYNTFALDGDTDYYIELARASGYYGLRRGENADISFSILENITKPITPAFNKLKRSSKSIYLAWTDVTSATEYQVRYRLKGSTKWTTQTVTKNSCTISGLKSKKKYEIKVRARRNVNGEYYNSAWCQSILTKTR